MAYDGDEVKRWVQSDSFGNDELDQGEFHHMVFEAYSEGENILFLCDDVAGIFSFEQMIWV